MTIEELNKIFYEAEKVRNELLFRNEELLNRYQEKLNERSKKS